MSNWFAVRYTSDRSQSKSYIYLNVRSREEAQATFCRRNGEKNISVIDIIPVNNTLIYAREFELRDRLGSAVRTRHNESLYSIIDELTTIIGIYDVINGDDRFAKRLLTAGLRALGHDVMAPPLDRIPDELAH